MSRLHSGSIILLETQAPIINTQWLSAVEQVKTHAQQKSIKALPLGRLLNLTTHARTLQYERYEHDAVMAVFEATAWLQTRVSAMPGGWISIFRSSSAQPLLPVMVVMDSEGHPIPWATTSVPQVPTTTTTHGGPSHPTVSPSGVASPAA